MQQQIAAADRLGHIVPGGVGRLDDKVELHAGGERQNLPVGGAVNRDSEYVQALGDGHRDVGVDDILHLQRHGGADGGLSLQHAQQHVASLARAARLSREVAGQQVDAARRRAQLVEVGDRHENPVSRERHGQSGRADEGMSLFGEAHGASPGIA